MINSVSSFSTKNNVMSKNFSDASVHSKLNQQISFTGLPIAALNKVDTTSLLSKVVGESKDLLTGSFRKMTGKTELPVVKKPIVATNKYDDNTNVLLGSLNKAGVDLSDVGTIQRSTNGGLQSIDKTLITTVVDEAQEKGIITAQQAGTYKSQISSCGGMHDTADMHAEVSDHATTVASDDSLLDVICSGVEKFFDFFGG